MQGKGEITGNQGFLYVEPNPYYVTLTPFVYLPPPAYESICFFIINYMSKGA